MKKKKLVTFLTSLSVLLGLGGATVLAMAETSVTNHLSTGIVDIELEEYQMEDGKEIPYEDPEDVLPGQVISKIPRIVNKGNDSYVRVKLDLEKTGESLEVQGIPEGWTEGQDGYLYYTETVKTDEQVDVFRQVKIPETYSKEEEGKAIELKITADAIQSRNFTPDFDAESPWGEVEIQECIKEGQYDVRSFKSAEDQNLQVVYQGDAGKLVSSPDDFFADFPVMLPGDSYEDSAELKNSGNSPIPLYFRSEAPEDATELLEKVQLMVSTEINGVEKTVYEGALKADALKEDILLGDIPGNASGKFTFRLTVPPELDNQYTVLADSVRWIFSTEPIGETMTPVQTGDLRKTGGFLLLSGITAGIGAWLVVRKGRRDEESSAGRI